MTTIVSSPGKVLLAGGYLVLDPAYSGVVVSTSSRFYTIIQSGKVLAAKDGVYLIRVRSTQFVDAVWSYSVMLNENEDSVNVEQVADNATASATKNKFVHLALQRTLALAVESKGISELRETLANGLDIAIAGDNDFYSQRAQLEAKSLPLTFSSLSRIPPFSRTNVRLADVHKTGLGSSAALITSLVSALLIHLSVVPKSAFGQTDDAVQSDGRKLAHNLSQYVHCLAQGKVGSGFDVAAAVFGSQVYTRFNPDVIQPLMTDSIPPLLPVLSPSNKAWDYRVELFRLPPLTRLMLADVDAGSDTPSLVGKVLKWRQADAETSHKLWDSLSQLNMSFGKIMLKLSSLHSANPDAYRSTVKYIATLQPLQWLANPNISPEDLVHVQEFSNAHAVSQSIRAKMREMGTLSGVPIEPPEQTALLDVCVSQAGVVAGGVPGAGGYDAIWLLVCDPDEDISSETPLRRVERVWNTWKGLVLTPLSAVESAAKGVRVIENIDEIPGLDEAVREQ